MIRKTFLLITSLLLASLSSIVLAHPEALYSASVMAQIMHSLISPYHLLTFVVAILLLGFASYKVLNKTKLQKVVITNKINKK